ncbi:MAG: pyridoxal phosphate-dependent aminotransferase [Nitrospirae bacterium]|uniref:pyridoxal phosphate-dependent aminotransferase n=1 Tax=Candidatus Magnetobacterium casense TaxID=1455061 RepID=UPI0005907CDB|nr:pyridoxal phosphate-dependent aminotransferase [Candidatus Magnetobacterium casensis]MBF0336599.1 pyridoxal phosphate-dependent aminotransferase [Nitrospirota bacterium]
MVSDRAKKIKPSPTLSIDAKAKEMKANGIDVISFAVGEPDFDTPDHIKAAAVKALNDGFTKYTPVGGIPELKTAIIEKFKRDNNLHYKPNEIVVSCGAKHSLYNAAQALYSAGDEVIIPAPYWVSYPDQVLLNDATPVIVQTTEADKFMLSPEALKGSITGKTKAIILNYPSNPTGFTYDLKGLEAIAEIVLKHNLWVVSDEIYEKLLYDGIKHVSIAAISNEIKQRTIVINGLSKAYAMTGWRLGYAAGSADVIKAMENIQSQSTSNTTSFAQKAAVEALNGPQGFIDEMLRQFDDRRRFLVAELNTIEGVSCIMPEGAFYAFANIQKVLGRRFNNAEIKNCTDLSMYLLQEAHVALVPGGAFGAEGFIRMSYATSMKNIKEGLSRLREALGKLS